MLTVLLYALWSHPMTDYFVFSLFVLSLFDYIISRVLLVDYFCNLVSLIKKILSLPVSFFSGTDTVNEWTQDSY